MIDSSSRPPVHREWLILLTLAGIQFTHILDFMIMMPLSPQLIRVLKIDTHHFGLLLSSYTFTAAISGLLAATYIDRFDRRKLLLTLYILFMLATLSCGLAQSFSQLLVARALAGAFGGVLGAMVQTMVADLIPFERRGKAMGTIMASFSLSTVAGVPLGLLLANHLPTLGWRAPFLFIVVLSMIIFAIGLQTLPSLTTHMDRPRQGSIFQSIWNVGKQPTHMKGFAFIALMMLGGFTVIPYIALYMTANVGLPESLITLAYLCGGAATFFTSQAIGRMADKYGKLTLFRWVALASLLPILVTTHLGPTARWLILIDWTIFFVLVPGRMVPAMAMVSAVAPPEVRGTFMSLVSSVQMAASGVASLVAGLIISRSASGQIEHYNLVGYLAVASTLLAIWIAPMLRVAATTPAPTTIAPATELSV